MEQDTEELFAAIAVEKGILSDEQASECQKARDEAGRLGLKVTLAKVAQDRGLLSLRQVREIHREMRKRGTAIRLGRYELLEKVGAGGMGAVWRARDTVLKRTVALKLLPRHRAGDSRFITRFRREATLASRIQHPNVVTVYEIGRSGDRHYIAMEFVEGQTVAERLKGGEPLSESEALDIARQVCEGLLVAHDQGIVHRDIKPSNIMISRSGLVKVADLGLAKAIEDEGPGLTHSGAVLGTPRYMSPEQCRSARNLDHRTDIYSLGATLFHMLTGRPPYKGVMFEIMRQHQEAPIPDVQQVNPVVSGATAGLVGKMMAKNPARRPQSCHEIIAAIQDYTRAIALDPEGGEAFLNRGNVYSNKGEYDRAIQHYTRAIALDPDYAEAFYNRGIALHEMGEYDRAIEDYTRAIALDPDDAPAYNNRGVVYASNGEYDAAIEDYDRAIALDPDFALAYNNRGFSYDNKGEYDRAIEDSRRAIALGLNSDYAEAYLFRGLTYDDMGEDDRAIEDYTRAIALKPDYAVVYLNRGVVYESNGEYERAIEDFTRVIALKPDDAEAYSSRGNAYESNGEYERAIEDYSEAIALDPDGAGAYCIRGNAYENNGEYERAIKDFTRAIALESDFFGAYNSRGLAYVKNGEYDRAIEDYDRAIALDPDGAEVFYNRGIAWDKMGEDDRAMEDFEMACNLGVELPSGLIEGLRRKDAGGT